MYKNYSTIEKTISVLFLFSFILIFLDAYQFLSIPLSWIGSFFLFGVILYIYRTEQIKINQIVIYVLVLALLPTIFNLSEIIFLQEKIIYTGLRLFSFISFVFITYIIAQTDYKLLILKSLKSAFLFITYFSLYVFIAQIFNFFEPFRNRPGTGIFGFDEQTNFWIYGSHRLIGSFREPIFLVSILFPVFVILHFKTNITKLNYALFAILFGLTKSEMVFLLVICLTLVDIIIRNINIKNFIFVMIFIPCFFIQFQECVISPENYECPESDPIEETIINKTVNEIEDLDNNSLETSQDLNLNIITFQDEERSDIVSFTTQNLRFNTGLGFQNTNSVYTKYLVTNTSYEMYLVNRTLPEYLNTRYLSETFGTGRYFLTYQDINIQNNLLFNVFSIGMIYVIFIFGLLLFFLLKDFNQGIKVILIILSISLASFEDLLPIFGLCLGLMFTMERYEDI